MVLGRTKAIEIVRGFGRANIWVTPAMPPKELRVGTTIGHRRHAKVLHGRIIKARDRVKRIAVLSRTYNKAARLYNTDVNVCVPSVCKTPTEVSSKEFI